MNGEEASEAETRVCSQVERPVAYLAELQDQYGWVTFYTIEK